MTDTPASLDALGIEPVAWLYKRTNGAAVTTTPTTERLPDWMRGKDSDETPLYSADDLAPLIAKARRVEELEAAITHALEIIIDSWGEDQIERGDDQAANILRAALKENTDATSD